jgi:hypothetical protein
VKGLFRWLIANPRHGAILTGLLVAFLLSYVSFPRQETFVKSVEDWRPPNFVSGATAGRLVDALDSADPRIVQVSEQAFRELAPAVAFARPVVAEDGRDFVIEYVGEAGGTLYAARRELKTHPWWSPDRFLYEAVAAPGEQTADVLQLTFQRDWRGLAGMLLVDLAFGALYGIVVGLLLAVLGKGSLDEKDNPPSSPMPAPRRRDAFRA